MAGRELRQAEAAAARLARLEQREACLRDEIARARRAANEAKRKADTHRKVVNGGILEQYVGREVTEAEARTAARVLRYLLVVEYGGEADAHDATCRAIERAAHEAEADYQTTRAGE